MNQGTPGDGKSEGEGRGDDGGAATPRFNSVLPDLGSGAGWDREDLAALLTLQRHPDGGLYSQHVDTNMRGAVFGGQLIGQAISAAGEGLADSLACHSLQLQFLAPGQAGVPMRYEVRRLLAGMSFTILHVLGVQGERTVISAHVSFQRPEAGPRFQQPMPEGVPQPEDLPTLASLMDGIGDRLPEAYKRRLGRSRTVDLRPLDAEAFLFQRDSQGRMAYWVRARQALATTPRLHHAALGYLSDYWFPTAALAPLVDDKIDTGLYIASLNHAIWFHRPVQADDWLLVSAQSPASGNARGLTLGAVHQRSGELVATLAQEGLYRGWLAEGEGESSGFVPPRGLSPMSALARTTPRTPPRTS